MSYYIGATGEYIWEELLENATSNVVISNNINFDATPLTDAIQQTITDALGTAVGELIQPVTEVPSATGVGVVALTALGLLSYYKLNRTAVQDVDSMVYSADYASILTPGMFDDRVRIRYDTNWFSNAFYYDGTTKKGEILTYRPEQGSNILNLNATNIKSGTIDSSRLPTNYGTKLGIGTSPVATADLHIYDATNANLLLETGATGTASIELQRGTINDVNVDFKIINDAGRFKILSQDEVNLYTAGTSEILRLTRTLMTNYKDFYNLGNVSIGLAPDTIYPSQLRVYNATNSVLRLEVEATGKTSIEFQNGAFNDANVDYRIINENNLFKIQSQNATNLYTAGTSELMRFSTSTTTNYKDFTNNGAFNNLGNVNISTTAGTSTYKLNVEGDVNITGIGKMYYVNNTPVVSSQWATSGTTIEYNGGSVGIGTSALSYKLNVGGSLNTTGLITSAGLTSSALITANAGLTIATGQTLTLSGTAGVSGLITANGGITIPTGQTLTANGQIVRLTGVVADNVKTDLEIMANSLTTPYSIKFVQHRITSTDFRYYIQQTDNGTEYTNPSLSFRVGNVGVGTNNPLNIFQVGSGNRLRIANDITDYSVIGTNDTDGTTNTRIIISGNTRTSVAGNIEYVATSTGKHIFYSAGNVERMRITDTGNVGIGTNNPTNRLHILNSSTGANPDTGSISLYVYNPTNSAGQNSVIINRVAGSASGRVLYGFDVNTAYGFSIKMEANSSALRFNNGWDGTGTDVMTLSNTGVLSTRNDVWHTSTEGAQRIYYAISNTTYLRGHGVNPFVFRNGADTDIGFITSGGNFNMYGGATITGDTFITSSRLVLRGNQPTLYLRDTDHRSGMIHMNGNIMYFLSASGNDSETWQVQNFQNWPLQLNVNNNDATFGGQITAYLVAVSMTNTDYVCVQLNYGSVGQGANLTLKVAYGSFTAFHRCYIDDVLYNNDTQENIDLFKTNYVGRVVIATGKIKTDFSRTIEADPDAEAEIDGMSGLPREKEKIDEWYSEIDKDGITIEDAVPIVRLSRQRKDKRVFGVLGGLRSTNNKDRLIVNSVGEGGICVSNTNGNIENGDYLQSSDLLGYGEKQDDDILHNYTIGKATIDCNFELDSPYYQCHEIENGVRVAFIACSYHCG